MPEEQTSTAETEAFYLYPEDSDLITQLAAREHRYNRSAALRAIIAEFRDRWYPDFPAINATPVTANWNGEQEPTDARND